MFIKAILIIILLLLNSYGTAFSKGKSGLAGFLVKGAIYGAIKQYSGNSPIVKRLEEDVVTLDKAFTELENITLPDIGNTIPKIEIKNGYHLAKGFAPDTGKLVMEGVIKNGQFNGPAKEYYSNGNIAREIIYKNNKIEGTVKIHFPNGNLASIFQVKDEIINGKSQEFYNSGELLSEMNFANNQVIGKYRLYLKSGKFYQLDGIDTGKTDFTMEEYSADKKLVYNHRIKNGKLEFTKAN